MQIYLVRHGETDYNSQKRLQGHLDNPLNENGRAQARNLHDQLKDIKFDIAYSSDLARANETAKIILEGRNQEVKVTSFLRERSFGKYDGITFDEFDKLFGSHYPTKDALPYLDQLKYRFDSEIETDFELWERFIKFLEIVKNEYRGDANILAVGHGNIMRAVLEMVDNSGKYSFAKARFNNCCYAVLNIESDKITIESTVGIDFVL